MRHLASRATVLAAATLAGLTAVASTAAADPIELRVATLAPAGSTWMKILDKGAATVSDKTDKRVSLKWYPGGVQGDERDYVRKINLGQLDGAAVTSVGLSMIDESIRVLELPRMFASVQELDYVANKMWPYFQKKFEKKGFKLTDRGEIGWIYFYSKTEVTTLDQLKGLKLWQWGDDSIVSAMYKKLGLNGTPLGVPEVDSALQTGRINGCYGSALTTVALQWNTKIKFQTEMPMSYGIGATVMSLAAWNKLTAEDQKTMAKLTEKMGGDIRKGVRKDNTEAAKQMKNKGVKLTPTPPAMVEQFTKASEEVWNDLAGKIYSKDELAQVLKYRDEYRAKHPAK